MRTKLLVLALKNLNYPLKNKLSQLYHNIKGKNFNMIEASLLTLNFKLYYYYFF